MHGRMCYRPLYLRGRGRVLRVCNYPMPSALAAPALTTAALALTSAALAAAAALAYEVDSSFGRIVLRGHLRWAVHH